MAQLGKDGEVTGQIGAVAAHLGHRTPSVARHRAPSPGRHVGSHRTHLRFSSLVSNVEQLHNGGEALWCAFGLTG